MEKLEPKQLVGYLPYALKVLSKRHFCKYGEQTILQVNGLAFQDTAETPYWQYEFVYDNDLKFSDINEKGFKPILRPLSDLTKEIEHNGEKFISLHRLLEASNFNLNEMPADEINSYYAQYTNIDWLHYNDALMLIKWHFDVFGLIEKRLAVDINSL